MSHSVLASMAAVLAAVVAHAADPAAQGRQRISGEEFVSEGIPKMPNPPRANLYWMKAQEFPETLCIPPEALQYRDTLAKPSGIQIVP